MSKHIAKPERKAQRAAKRIAKATAAKAIAVRAMGGIDKKQFLAGAGTAHVGIPSTAGAGRLRGFWNSTEARRSAQLGKH